MRDYFLRGALSSVLIALIVLPAIAQDPTTWLPPKLVVQTEGEVPIGSMALIADGMGQLHWFFAHRPDEGVTAGIDYIWWNGETWSESVNVMVNSDGSSISNVRAAIDADQNIHLLWNGGSNTLNYATAPVQEASLPRAWSAPVNLASAISDSDIIVGPENTIYIAYVDPSSYVVTVMMSDDGEGAWATPSSVAASSDGSIPREVRIAVDKAGRQHVVWTEVQLPGGWPPTGVFYSRSLDGGLSWNPRLQIAGFGYAQIGIATVGNDEVHIVYPGSTALPGGSETGMFHQLSMDGGETWSVPERFVGQNGLSGVPSFAIDNMRQLHYVIGQAFYTSWQGSALEPYVDVAGELRIGDRSSGWTPPERAVIAITLGNRLHVVFETGFQKLWHTTKLLDMPELPTATPVEIPPLELIATPVTTKTILPSTSVPAFDLRPIEHQSRTTLVAPFSGVVVIALLVIVLVIIKARGAFN